MGVCYWDILTQIIYIKKQQKKNTLLGVLVIVVTHLLRSNSILYCNVMLGNTIQYNKYDMT